jgi:WS/DGAT/MGAT family acyltransferase
MAANREEGSEMKALSGLDAAFLYAETSTMPMNVVGTIILDAANAAAPCSYERIQRHVEDRLPRMEPLRRRLARVAFDFEHPVWIEDAEVRVEQHVRRVQAPAPGSDRVLAELVGRIAARPLDRSRPLWQLSVIEGLERGRMALVMKLHHALADGMACVELLLRLLDPSPKPGPSDHTNERRPPEPSPSGIEVLGDALSRFARRPARIVGLLSDLRRSTAALARLGTSSAARPALPFGSPRTRFNGAISPRRAVAFGKVRLADIEFVKSTFGATVNDVVLAASSHSLRNYLEAHGDLPGRPLVAMVPVSVRAAEEKGSFDNRVSAFFVRLPVQLGDPVDQLLAIRDESRAAKQIHAALGGTLLGSLAEIASPALFSKAMRVYSELELAKHHRPLQNVVISNLPGPTDPVYAAGARVEAAYPHGPVLEGAGMNITVMRYQDSLDLGVIACRQSVPDVGEIALGFCTAVGDLVERALEESRASTAARTAA